VEDAGREGERVTAALRAAGVAVEEWRVVEPSLEDVFMDRVITAERAAVVPPGAVS
jgi:ribosomal protein L12E/L44/L45/RPP1/RPP2